MRSSLFSESNLIENSYDPTNQAMALSLDMEDEGSDPLDMLIAIEERLMDEFGVTFIQAVNEYRKSRRG